MSSSLTFDSLFALLLQNFLLTEILKKAGVSSAYLFSIIRENRIAPSWMEIPLPPGRSLSSCQTAFYRMEQEYTSQYRQSIPGPPAPLQMSPIIRKRPAPPGERPLASAPRAIQPKPHTADTSRYSMSEVRTGVPIPRAPEPPRGDTPRKRGRPSKVEMQRRRIAEEARSQAHPAAQPNHTTPRPGYAVGILPATSPATSQTPYSPAMGQRPPPEQPREPDPPTPMSVQYHGTETPPSQTQDIQVQRGQRPQQPLMPRAEGARHLQDSPMIIESKDSNRPAQESQNPQAEAPPSGNGQRPDTVVSAATTTPTGPAKPESPGNRELISPEQPDTSPEEDKGS
ncbi:hypothetical protein MGYG_03871 [Nannizzia gypsea CBS 118893]|uniref:AT hook domain-containing protein n=1 Tax=Arthroderma gypseum (strain ATCC MYA-4604 / CBS 118893) TaxID=535722 RepID=E4UUA1_ARTGP|nr:hypothetical protein MGYG_03871 [Nannizzia gypsea CBS 118893]EFR00868.1 hypothetical protein MGYG_03871 [Nannizzia gypsea CBS 118893]